MDSTKNIDPKTGIWSMNIAKKRHKFDIDLAFAIYKTFPNVSSVADIGCGDGKYCAFLKACGIKNVIGYEGTPNIQALGFYDRIIEADLTKDWRSWNHNRAEAVLFLEVAEHVPMQYEDVMLNNVVNMVDNYLIMSWAPEDQYSASGHVNPRSIDYAIQKIRSMGLSFRLGLSTKLASKASFDWFKNNLMVFERLS